MKIGIDLDDTITYNPEFFRILIEAFLIKHEVHIITFRSDIEETKQDLSDLGFHFPDLQIHIPTASDEDLDMHTWKGKLAANLGLDVMIDDSPEVIGAMPPGVTRLWLTDPEVFNMDKCIKALKQKPIMDRIS